jgi:spore maturation protein CgeB
MNNQWSRQRWVIVIYYNLFVDDVVPLLRAHGFSVKLLKPSDLKVDAFKQLCAQLRPEFIFTINFSPEMAFLATLGSVPYVSWTVDPLPPSRYRLYADTRTELCLAFVHRRTLVDQMPALGIKNVEYLPLAASHAKRGKIADTRRLAPYACQLSFVGSSLADERARLSDWLARKKLAASALQSIELWLKKEFFNQLDDASFRGLALSDVTEELTCLCQDSFEQVELLDLLNGLLSHYLRIERIKACQRFDTRVYGDNFWATVTSQYYGVAQHGQQTTLIYNASLLNLDIPRIYQRDIITMRVFDILLCGGCLLTEFSPEILEYFRDGVHLMTYRNQQELLERAEICLKDAALRQQLSEAGRAHVLQTHLLSHRIETILQRFRTWSEA